MNNDQESRGPSGPDPAAVPDLPGITLANRPFHRGPSAVVYRGWDRVHRCQVVVKVQRATEDSIARNRFRREAAVMSRLRHPGIAALYAYHEEAPAALVMEYVPGETLAALVGRGGALAPAHAAQVVEEVAAALDCAHALGIVHRDVKPANILLARRGPAKLTDFGVARLGDTDRASDDVPLTVMGDILGTIEYASPEQVHGNETPDSRSDVYSLAAVAYFALTGTPPFRAADASTQAQLSVMHRQVFADPPPLRSHRAGLSAGIEEAVLRGLSKAPGARYASAGQFAAALRAAVEAASGQPQQRAAAREVRRTAALGGALAGAGALGLTGYALWRVAEFVPPAPPVVAGNPSPGPARPPVAAHIPVAAHPRIAARLPAAAHTPPAALPVPPVRVARALPVSHPRLTVRPRRRLMAAARRPVPPAPAPAAVIAAVRLPAPAAPRRLASSKAYPAKAYSASVPSAKLRAAQAPRPALLAAAPRPGWLQVFASQNTAPLGQPEKMANIPARNVFLDGKPVSALAGGRWLAVPPGRHTVSFYPEARSGFSPRTGVPVEVASGAYVGKQVLLPLSLSEPLPALTASAAPAAAAGTGWYTVSGWVALAALTPSQKSELVRADAQWIKVDGRPVPSLALGQWATLPAGPHVVTFQPMPGLGVGPKTWNIDLAPQAHLSQQIPLPSAPLPAVPPHLRTP